VCAAPNVISARLHRGKLDQRSISQYSSGDFARNQSESAAGLMSDVTFKMLQKSQMHGGWPPPDERSGLMPLLYLTRDQAGDILIG
jgi:hypothetical protein